MKVNLKIIIAFVILATALALAVFNFIENSQTENFLANLSENQTSSGKEQQTEQTPIVKDNKTDVDEKIAGGCAANHECWEAHYQSLVKNQGIKAAFEDLKKQYQENSLIRSLCHPFVHVIGRQASLQFKNPGEAFLYGDAFCWSGYYHGVMEGILYRTAKKDVPKTINTICQNISGKENYSFDYYNCVHGTGHGLMYISNNELFESLEMCDFLDGLWEKESCYGGVFMENVIADFENHFTKYLKPQEPLYPCTSVAEQYKTACYLMQTSYLLKINGYDFADAFEQCSIIEESHKNTCYQSVGRDASGSTTSNLQKTKQICLLGKNERQQKNCVIGAVKDFISYFHSDIQARQLCDSFDGNIKETCHQTAKEYYSFF